MSHSPFIMLDETSDAPLYRQIYEAIRHSILSGEFVSGSRLPASRLLATQLAVSRMTVINAYEQLLAEGYLESRRGAGTFVAEHLPEEFINTPQVKQHSNSTGITQRELKLSEYGKNILHETGVILRCTRPTKIVPFQHGLAAVNEFPFDIWTKLANKCYQKLRRDEFGYGDAAGFYPLRQAISEYLSSARAVICEPEQIIITNGAQQAFDLIGRILLEPKDEFWIENPGYFGARRAFKSFGAFPVPVSLDENGFDLTKALNQSKNARLAYVTPSHQFPLGITMSLPRRLQLLEWAKNTQSWIVEDDYDSEFRYEGRPLASLQGLDREGRVLYIGTFSKTVFPALRLGCIVVPHDLIELFSAVRTLSGSPSTLIEQATLAEFISEGHLARHIRRMRRLYEERQEILIAEIEKHLAGRIEVKKSVSGMHLIGWLNDDVKDYEVAKRAEEFGVRVAAVTSHSLTEWNRGGLILGYTAINEKQIKKGVQQLAKAMDSLMTSAT